jgi:hypothetical protein
MRKGFKARWHERGLAATEAALVVPILLVLTFGIIALGLAGWRMIYAAGAGPMDAYGVATGGYSGRLGYVGASIGSGTAMGSCPSTRRYTLNQSGSVVLGYGPSINAPLRSSVVQRRQQFVAGPPAAGQEGCR